MNQALAELISKKQKAAADAPIDWDERRDRYVAAVHALYDQVEGILTDSIRQRVVTARRADKTLTESYIGTYGVPDLVLTVGNEQVRFSPRGRNIVGAGGRVDVLGERAEAVLLFQPETGWQLLLARQPNVQTQRFDESTLAEVLHAVMRD